MNKQAFVMGGIIVVVIAAMLGLAFFLKSISPTPITANPDIVGDKVFTRDYSHMTGSKDAKVTLVEFGDYQCPYCGAAYPTVKQVTDKYQSNPNFNFIFRNFPLTQHPNAQEAAEAAEAAGAQGKYFEMNGILYTNQNDWSGNIDPTSNFVSYATQLGLDVAKFTNEIKTSKYIDQITQDEKDGEALGVNSTPTFYLNGQQLKSYTDLDAQVTAALAK